LNLVRGVILTLQGCELEVHCYLNSTGILVSFEKTEDTTVIGIVLNLKVEVMPEV